MSFLHTFNPGPFPKLDNNFCQRGIDNDYFVLIKGATMILLIKGALMIMIIIISMKGALIIIISMKGALINIVSMKGASIMSMQGAR